VHRRDLLLARFDLRAQRVGHRHRLRDAAPQPLDRERHGAEIDLVSRRERDDLVAEHAAVDPRAVRRAEIAQVRRAVLEPDLGVPAR
jgi:hypothetical protein